MSLGGVLQQPRGVDIRLVAGGLGRVVAGIAGCPGGIIGGVGVVGIVGLLRLLGVVVGGVGLGLLGVVMLGGDRVVLGQSHHHQHHRGDQHHKGDDPHDGSGAPAAMIGSSSVFHQFSPPKKLRISASVQAALP